MAELSVTGPLDRINGPKVDKFTHLVMEAASEIAEQIDKAGWIL